MFTSSLPSDQVVSIALVEDNPADVRWFQLVVSELGIRAEVSVFGSGTRALEHFRNNLPPSLIITDWRLPMLTLAEFVEAIRAIPRYRSTPLAVCTGTADICRDESLRLGAICCLQKPVDAANLREVFALLAKSATA